MTEATMRGFIGLITSSVMPFSINPINFFSYFNLNLTNFSYLGSLLGYVIHLSLKQLHKAFVWPFGYYGS